MSMIARIAFAFFATVFFSAAQAQAQWCGVNPWLDGCEISENQHDVLFHIDTAGVIRDLATGQTYTPQGALDHIATLGPAGVIIVGIVIGGGSGVASAWGKGTGTMVLLAGLGAVTGYYGALATMAGWASVAIYGSAVIGTQYLGSRIMISQPPGGGCLTVTDSNNCLIKAN